MSTKQKKTSKKKPVKMKSRLKNLEKPIQKSMTSLQEKIWKKWIQISERIESSLDV